jgi:lycopene cyclase domain-containing protein
LNTHYTYLLILACSLAGPLALSFDKKVSFYKKWKQVFMAMILPAIFYCIWDGIFANMHIWFFHEKYITGIFIFNLPIEEVLFFFVVPYCCIFIYECVRSYFPLLRSNKKADGFLWVLAFLLLIVGIISLKLYYTSYTSIFLAVFIFMIMGFRKYFAAFNSSAFLVAYSIILIPFLIVNGFLTAIPVITYNDTKNLATRIYTIPVEDIFYGMLLVMMNVVGYEKFLKREDRA